MNNTSAPSDSLQPRVIKHCCRLWIPCKGCKCERIKLIFCLCVCVRPFFGVCHLGNHVSAYEKEQGLCSENCYHEFYLFGITPCNLIGVYDVSEENSVSILYRSHYHKSLKPHTECPVEMTSAEIMSLSQGRFSVELFTYKYSLINA
jgi:hypothetical protein